MRFFVNDSQIVHSLWHGHGFSWFYYWTKRPQILVNLFLSTYVLIDDKVQFYPTLRWDLKKGKGTWSVIPCTFDVVVVVFISCLWFIPLIVFDHVIDFWPGLISFALRPHVVLPNYFGIYYIYFVALRYNT